MIATAKLPACSGQLLATALVLCLCAVNSSLGQERAHAPAGAAKAAPKEGSAWAGITSLEQFLTRALTTHPEVVAAEAKVALAQAELRQTRFETARELIAFWNDWKAAEQEVAAVTELYKSATVPHQQFVEAKAKLAKLESQLPYLLGQAGDFRPGGPGGFVQAGPKRAPEGPQVEKIIKALNEPSELEFVDTPLRDVVATLADYHRTNITTDPVGADVPVTASIKDVTLAAALQMIEDRTPGVRFVVTDYGILATSDTSAAAATYISANEFWREHVAQGEPSAQKDQGAVAWPAPAKEHGPWHSADDPFAPGPSAPAAKDPFGAPSPAPNDPFGPPPPAAAKPQPAPASSPAAKDPFGGGPKQPEKPQQR
jgi:hypothetical protein